MRVSFDLDEVLFVDPRRYSTEPVPDRMHVNPDDEFSDPKVGPSEEIVERYMFTH